MLSIEVPPMFDQEPEESPLETSDPILLLPPSKQALVRRRMAQDAAAEEERGRQFASDDAELSAHIEGRKTHIGKLFDSLRSTIIAEETGAVMNPSPERIVADIAFAQRDLGAAVRHRTRNREWKRTSDEIAAAYDEFAHTASLPEMPRLQAELKWRTLAVAAGTMRAGELRRLREQIEDLS
jgi:hypothetical protein